MTTRRELDALKANFAAERQALRGAEYRQLAALADERMALFGRLTGEGLDHPELTVLRREAARNTALADAAAAGIKDALQRLRTLKAAAGPIGSYGATGRSERIGTPAPSVRRKA